MVARLQLSKFAMFNVSKNPDIVVHHFGPGTRPVITVFGRTMPEAWERAMWATHKFGISIKTEYDKPKDPPSKDCRATMIIAEPLAEPRIHRDFPGSLEDLAKYRFEVVEGVHDHLINPQENKWPYTYHDLLFNWLATDDVAKREPAKLPFNPANQIDYIVEKLSSFTYSRRAQATTWNPLAHPNIEHPPCLQRIWCRLFQDKKGAYVLNFDTDWRSRDAYKGAPMNMFAIIDLGRIVAERISEKIGKEVKLGTYTDTSNSFHLYGAYFDEFSRFLKGLEARKFEERTWTTDFAKPFLKDGIKQLLEEQGMPEDKIKILKKELEKSPLYQITT
jgi:thymidylate synthase